ncbi:hypothetical protein [Novosphingobium sp. Leaf2]|uniref:hypothetical protein n=1 Tax=Novosphingobium sp. Leaf2 TaxID=1735670 RepID=UPI000A961A3B|nr:hypothetical protein [Novosphingobium sp. Leaf2]
MRATIFANQHALILVRGAGAGIRRIDASGVFAIITPAFHRTMVSAPSDARKSSEAEPTIRQRH